MALQIPPRNFGTHQITWEPSLNKINIHPKFPNKRFGVTPHFGLGNAVIRLNLNRLPTQIVKNITGDTTAQGIAPTSPFKLKRWYGMPLMMKDTPPRQLTMQDGSVRNLIYPEAQGGSVKEVAPTQIIQNGYGSEEIVGTPLRLNW